MAKHEDLPIYKITYDMIMLIMRTTNKLPREYKYTFGEKIQSEAIKIIMGIYRANKSLNKTKDLRELTDSTQELRILLRICGAFSRLSYTNRRKAIFGKPSNFFLFSDLIIVCLLIFHPST